MNKSYVGKLISDGYGSQWIIIAQWNVADALAVDFGLINTKTGEEGSVRYSLNDLDKIL